MRRLVALSARKSANALLSDQCAGINSLKQRMAAVQRLTSPSVLARPCSRVGSWWPTEAKRRRNRDLDQEFAKFSIEPMALCLFNTCSLQRVQRVPARSCMAVSNGSYTGVDVREGSYSGFERIAWLILV